MASGDRDVEQREELKMASFPSRILGASLLRSATYEEIEADRDADGQAFGVVLLAAVGAGIGSFENAGGIGMLTFTLATVGGWYIWAYSAFLIGTRLLPSSETVADQNELLRVIGFSAAPGILRIFMLIEDLALPIFVISNVWMLIAMVIAVRQALDYSSTTRAVAVCVIGFPIYALALVGSILTLGPWPV
jgi:hypothetical protein